MQVDLTKEELVLFKDILAGETFWGAGQVCIKTLDLITYNTISRRDELYTNAIDCNGIHRIFSVGEKVKPLNLKLVNK